MPLLALHRRGWSLPPGGARVAPAEETYLVRGPSPSGLLILRYHVSVAPFVSVLSFDRNNKARARDALLL